jgi:hypothetical protein
MENLITKEKMKNFTIYLRVHLLFLFLFASICVQAQEQRTLKTRVADVLAKLPANDNAEGEKIYNEILGLGEEGVTMIVDGLQPNGKQQGVPNRFAVALLTHYGKDNQKALIEKVYLASLQKSTDKEVKAYLLANLERVGTDAAVPAVVQYLTDEDLASPAIGTLESIGTKTALNSLASALPSIKPGAQVRAAKAFSLTGYKPALGSLTNLASSPDVQVKKAALRAHAELADISSAKLLSEQAAAVGYKPEPSEATLSLLMYAAGIKDKDAKVAEQIGKDVLANTDAEELSHLRLAALRVLPQSAETTKTFVTESNKFDDIYRREVLKIAGAVQPSADVIAAWQAEYKKSSGERQGDLLTFLSTVDKDNAFASKTLVPALSHKNANVRIAAVSALAATRSREHAKPVVDYLLRSNDEKEILAATDAVLLLVDKSNTDVVGSAITNASPKHQVVLLNILKQRRASDQFNTVASLTSAKDPAVRKAAFETLASVATSKNTQQLIGMLDKNEGETLVALQGAIISSLDSSSSPVVMTAYQASPTKLLPVLPYVNDKTVLSNVERSFYGNNPEQRQVAFSALTNWQNDQAIRTLLNIRNDKSLTEFHEKALASAIVQVNRSSIPDDQKLLFLKQAMDLATTDREKISVLRGVGNLRTFLSLMFVAQYIDDEKLGAAASRSAMQISLPTSDARPGLTGTEVRNVLQRILDKLQGGDSQYERIDIQTYMEQMPYTRGFEAIFNGNDLTGWQGLVEDPIKRSKMTADELAKRQAEANAKLSESWSVKDGAIWFSGNGGNLCTIKKYGDFEMIVDWKISRNGDSGIYLRGSPQIQIWDTSRVDAGAQVGSGGLYNNKQNRSTPLVVADNPVGEWNTFNIKMVGDKVTVFLNGVLVVDNVTMENYWDRSMPIFASEAIELQAHGTELAFRNIYVKELSGKAFELSQEEKQEGFEVLFNGKDLDNWTGNKTDYVIEDNTIAVYPSKDSHGNLSTVKEYGDFIFRFEFQLTPGANNGLGIHAPLEGDAAYVGKEIQILDNTAPVYAKLEPWQYHGSVYGVLAAKRDFLKPVGEWNEQEVYVKGDLIRVTLNGTVIAEGDLKKLTKKGTLDKKDHPGLKSHRGHISFLGHGSVVRFRNIRVKELKD